MSSRLFMASLAASLAGFLFGFDMVVISGANLPLKELWQTSDWFHGMFIMSMALWGTVLGALLASIPTDRYGRKNTLIGIGILYFVSAMGSALANDPYWFSFFRFIGGIGVGISSIAVPIYISEISSAENRGRLGILYQFNIVLGILIAYISNYALDDFGGDNSWRWMLGVEALPAFIYTALVLGIPQSPVWVLLREKDEPKAKAILTKLYDSAEADRIVQAHHVSPKAQSKSGKGLFVKKYKRPIVLAFLIALFNQISGINVVLYYAPEILQKVGFGSSDSLLSSILIGIVNIVATLAGMALIDRAGRKQLMYIGSVGYIVSLFAIAYGLFAGAAPSFTLVFILVFIASHGIGQGSVIWIFISEIFPDDVRAAGQAFGSGTHWVFAALLTLFGSVLINSFAPWVIFVLFGCFMILQLLYTHKLMPETKGKTLEQIEEELIP